MTDKSFRQVNALFWALAGLIGWIIYPDQQWLGLGGMFLLGACFEMSRDDLLSAIKRMWSTT